MGGREEGGLGFHFDEDEGSPSVCDHALDSYSSCDPRLYDESTGLDHDYLRGERDGLAKEEYMGEVQKGRRKREGGQNRRKAELEWRRGQKWTAVKD